MRLINFRAEKTFKVSEYLYFTILLKWGIIFV
jgi:hypothetical protein